MDERARQKGIAEAGQAQQNFGVDASLLGRTLGIPAELLNVRNNAPRTTGNGFFSAFGAAATA
jgi:hypothetical protein